MADVTIQGGFNSGINNPNRVVKGGKKTISQFEFSPETRAQLDAAAGGLPGLTQGLQGVAGRMFTNFSGFTPQLQTQFTGPNFNQGLDAFSRNLISQGSQDLARQAAMQAAQAQRQFGGGVGSVLGQQAAAQARLQQNPLLFQAAQQQRGREGQEFQLAQQAQNLTNQALLAQAQQGIQGQQLQNQALLQQGLIPLEAQQNLLGQLGQYAQLTGRQSSFEEKDRPSGANWLGRIFGGLAGGALGLGLPGILGGAAMGDRLR